MKESISKIVELARLKFQEKELEKFSQKAKHVLDYIEQLKKLDTSKIEPTSHAIEIVNAFRQDKQEKFQNAQKILEIAPVHQENLFEVPKVIDEN